MSIVTQTTVQATIAGNDVRLHLGKRAVDVLVSVPLALLLAPLGVTIALLVKLTSPGPVLYWSERVGKDNRMFRMPKFRTMSVDTPPLATHLLEEPDRFSTPIGRLLRRTSLDELPQLYCVFRGDMSLVGPRPALFNQEDLVEMRSARGVHRLFPGLTGWAQINGRDHCPLEEKVALDEYYAKNASLWLDLCILVRTVPKVLLMKDVRH